MIHAVNSCLKLDPGVYFGMHTYPEDGDAGKTLLCQLQRQEKFGFPSSQEPKEWSGLEQVEFLLQVEQPTDISMTLHPEGNGSCNSDQINAVRALSPK